MDNKSDEPMIISDSTQKILDERPTAVGMLKGVNPIKSIDYMDVQYDNGMFLYHRPPNSVFLFRDVTKEEAEEIAADFEFSKFWLIEQMKPSQIEYLEEWRARDLVMRQMSTKLNTILYIEECSIKPNADMV